MRRGVTLLELLVVILIVMMVTAAAIPIMAPALQNRRMREAARLASSYFSGARARAIATGRDVGVVIERFNGNPFAMQMSYVEMPPPYGGETTGATCTVTDLGVTTTVSQFPYSSPLDKAVSQPPNTVASWFAVTFVSPFNRTLARMHDQIQFNYQGPLYTILGPDANQDGIVDDPGAGTPVAHVALISTTAASGVRWPWATGGTPNNQYQIFRQPIRSSAAPLQLPDGVVIDLMNSGMGIGGTFEITTGIAPSTWLTTTTPPVPFNPLVTFTPNGAVGYLGTTTMARPTGPIFLLLGRRELMADVTTSVVDENMYDPAVAPAKPKNLYLSNFWISIGYQTGLVTVTEMAVNPRPPSTSPTVAAARAFAQTAQGIGGL